MSDKRVAPSPHAHLRVAPSPRAQATPAAESVGSPGVNSRVSNHTNKSSPSGAHKNGGASLGFTRYPHEYLFETGDTPSLEKQQRLMARVHHQLITLQEIMATLDRSEQLILPSSTSPADATSAFAPARKRHSSDPADIQDSKGRQVRWGLLTRDKVDQYYKQYLYNQGEGSTEKPSLKKQYFTRIRFYCYLCLSMGLSGALAKDTHSALVQGCLRLFKEYKHLQLSFDLKTRDLRRLGRKV